MKFYPPGENQPGIGPALAGCGYTRFAMIPNALALPRKVAAAILLVLFAAPPSFGWGNDGHRMVNRLAVQKLPAETPAFLRTPEALEEIEYLGPEPDRWRSPAEPELNAAQAPEHFIDLELADTVGPLPRNRFDYITALAAAQAVHPELNLKPEKVGLQPYVAIEVYERLKAAMREYRTLSADHRQVKPTEDAILFYAGWLGHYVADGSMPLHVTINYDGWVSPENPHGYTTQHGIHSQFESAFVAKNIRDSAVAPLMQSPHTLADPFTDYVAYLRQSGTQIERVYQLEKLHGFEEAGSEESRAFTAGRLAAGATMLRDMIYTAWVESARPVPDWHASGRRVVPVTKN
ncbi:MAG TPA: S1/P1 nuclease [Acidisarcina sp.]|nr:S1/P1 nuclease [Acidisarcina sp.]